MIAAGISQTTAIQGQPFPVSLQCGINLMGNPAPTVLWRTNNGTVVISGGRYSIDNGPSNALLNISNVDRTINGTWTCMLSNGILAPILVNISLFVLGEECLFSYFSGSITIVTFSPHSTTISATKCDQWSCSSH